MRVMRAAAAAALLCAGLAACSSAGAAGGSGSGSGAVAAASSDVSFAVDGTKTYGTLEVPAHRSGQHLAAADRQHMLVVGHSEGGFYAMLVADTVSAHPAGLALLEPQDQRILSLVALQLDEQLNAAVQQGQLSASAAQQQAEGIGNAIAQFRAGQQVETDGLLPQIVQQLTPELLTPGNAKVARTDDAVSPVDAAAKVAAGTRVLVTDGTADTNIPVSTISPLASALKGAGTTGPELKVLTGVNHLLHEPGTADNDAVLAPSVVAALKAWAQPFA